MIQKILQTILCLSALLSCMLGTTAQVVIAANVDNIVDSKFEKLAETTVWVKNDSELKKAVGQPGLKT